MRLRAALCVALMAMAAACSRRDDTNARERRDRAGSAAREAGRAAHRMANDADKAARKAGKELRDAAREAREGWKEEGGRADRAKGK